MIENSVPSDSIRDLVAIAADGNSVAMNQLAQMDWERCQRFFTHAPQAAEHYQEFVSECLMNAGFWATCSAESHDELAVWLKREFVVYRNQARRRDATDRSPMIDLLDSCAESSGSSDSRSNPQRVVDDVEWALSVWRSIKGKFYDQANQRTAAPILRLEHELAEQAKQPTQRRTTKLRKDANATQEAFKAAVRREFVLLAADPTIEPHRNEERWWIVMRHCLHESWIDWKTGYPNETFRRTSSLNLHAATPQMLKDSTARSAMLTALFRQPLHRCLTDKGRPLAATEGVLDLALRSALSGPRVSVAVLRDLKHWAKQRTIHGDRPDDQADPNEGLYAAIYWGSIAAGIVHHQRPLQELSSLSADRVYDRLIELADDPLIASASWLRELLAQACRQLRPSDE